MRYLRIYILLVVGMALAACQPDTECRQSGLVPMVTITMRQVQDTTQANMKVITVWDSITVKGVGCDSVLYNNQKGVSKLLLPTRADSNSCGFAILYHEKWDTLNLYYDNAPQFVSMECGCSVYQTLHDNTYCTRHATDSMIIFNSSVTPQREENIMFIYLDFEKK